MCRGRGDGVEKRGRGYGCELAWLSAGRGTQKRCASTAQDGWFGFLDCAYDGLRQSQAGPLAVPRFP